MTMTDYNANRISYQLFGKDFGRLNFEQMKTVERVTENEFDLGEHHLPIKIST